MKFRKIFVLMTILVGLSVFTMACTKAIDKDSVTTESSTEASIEESTEIPNDGILYENMTYGFNFKLPISWEAYMVLEETWTGTSSDIEVTGPEIVLRHPNWSDTKPMQDIPILIFTIEQWKDILAEKYNVSAAPIPPTLLGENNTYVFALPPRYNFAFLDGFEDVETILKEAPMSTYDIVK